MYICLKQKPSPETFKLRRRATAGIMAAIGFLAIAKGPQAVNSFVNKVNGKDIPAFDHDYTVREGDSPDYIAEMSDVQGSGPRNAFDDAILKEAKAQGNDQLMPGMIIKVPSQFIENLDKQDQQSN